MYTIVKSGLVVALALNAVPAFAAVDVAAGKVLYGTCIACHGASGEGNPALNSPALGGQDAAYIERQLSNFKAGLRGTHPADIYGMQMRSMAAILVGEAASANVAAYIGTLPTSPGAAREYDRRNGENQYNAACGACHGGRAEGNPALQAPRLAGLDEAYLRRQLAYFRDGVRGAAPQDRLGKQMAMMADMVSTDKDISDVIGYILAQ